MNKIQKGQMLVMLLIAIITLQSYIVINIKGTYASANSQEATYPVNKRNDIMDYYPPVDIIDAPRDINSKKQIGMQKVLVLLVEFLNAKHNSTHDSEYFEKLIFDATYGVKSLRNYIYEVSYQQLIITGGVYDLWLSLPKPIEYYGTDDLNDDDGDGRISDDEYADIEQLIVDTLNTAENSGLYLPDYDGNGDGYVDHLIVVHSSPPQECTGVQNHIYSRSNALPTPYISQNSNTKVDRYVLVSEYSPFGVIVQKFMLDLGAPLLLDRDYSSDGIGIWGVMGHGFRLDNGNTPSHPTAYTKGILGWLDPYIVDTRLYSYSLPCLESGGYCVIVPLRANNDGDIREALMIEYRITTGFDEYLPGSGVLIYHIDYEMPSNDDELNPLIYLLEADGDDALMEYGGDMGNIYDAFGVIFDNIDDSTLPSTRDRNGIATGWSISSIELHSSSATMDIIPPTRDLAFYKTLVSSHFIELGEDVEIKIGIINYGIEIAKGNLDFFIMPITEDLILYNYTLPVYLGRWETTEYTLKYQPERTGRFIIKLEISIVGDTVYDNNIYATTLYITTFLFRDDVENGNKGWNSYSTTPFIPPGWHIVAIDEPNGDAYSGNHSWWCGFDATGLYQRATDFILESKDIEVGGGNATLYFHHRYEINPGLIFGFLSDSAYVEISTDNGNTWTVMREFRGTQPEWAPEVVLLSPYLPKNGSVIKIRFRINSNLLFLGGGWYLDDIAIVGEGLYHAIDVYLNPMSATIYPGDSLKGALHIINYGNSIEDINIEYVITNISAAVDLETEEVNLMPWASITVMFTITMGNTVQYNKNGTVRFIVDSDNISAECTINVLTGLVIDIRTNIEHEDLVVFPPKAASLNVTITNMGNRAENIIASIEGSSYVKLKDKRNFYVEPYSTISTVLSFDVSSDVAANQIITLDLKFSVDYPIPVGARIINASITHKLNITVGESHEILMYIPIDKIYMGPGDMRTVTIQILNMGNVPEIVHFEAVTSNAEVEVWFSQNVLIIQPLQNTITLLNIMCGNNLTGETCYIYIQAKAESGYTTTITQEIHLVYPDINVSITEIKGKWYDNERKLISVNIVNNGEHWAIGITLNIYVDGKLLDTRMIEALDIGEETSEDFTVKLKSGHHIIRCVVNYSGSEINKNNNEDIIEINVEPRSSDIQQKFSIGSIDITLFASILLAILFMTALLYAIKKASE